MTEKENINESVASKNEQTTSHNPNLTQDVVELNTLKRKVLRNAILVIFVILLVVSNISHNQLLQACLLYIRYPQNYLI